jgi:hypothetical protein
VVTWRFRAGGKTPVLAAGFPAEKPTPELDHRVEVAALNLSDTESVRQLAAGLERLDSLVRSNGREAAIRRNRIAHRRTGVSLVAVCLKAVWRTSGSLKE